MGLQDQAKAKNIKGKIPEATGDRTDNHEALAKGKAKQVETKVHDEVEEVKDKAKK